MGRVGARGARRAPCSWAAHPARPTRTRLPRVSMHVHIDMCSIKCMLSAQVAPASRARRSRAAWSCTGARSLEQVRVLALAQPRSCAHAPDAQVLADAHRRMLTRAQKRAKLEAETREDAQCPVCFEDGAVRCGCGELKGILCSNNHATCIDCVCKLVRPCVNNCPCRPPTHQRVSVAATNYHYDCPLCRVRTGLTHFEVMALIKRDRKEAAKVVGAAFAAEAVRARDVHTNPDEWSESGSSISEYDDDSDAAAASVAAASRLAAPSTIAFFSRLFPPRSLGVGRWSRLSAW